MVNSTGPEVEKFIRLTPQIRMTQFTGSQGVAERLAEITRGKIRLEDAGFDWKV